MNTLIQPVRAFLFTAVFHVSNPHENRDDKREDEGADSLCGFHKISVEERAWVGVVNP